MKSRWRGAERYRYDGIFQDQRAGGGPIGTRRRSDRRRISSAGERCRERGPGVGSGEKKGGDRLKKAEKREDTSTGIIQSRIGRRSCRLRDRTQNDVGAPPGPGTTHRRQNKCTCGRAQMVVVAVVAGVRAETTRMMRKTNESSTASTLSMTFGRWEPVRNRTKTMPEAWSAHQFTSIRYDRKPNTKED